MRFGDNSSIAAYAKRSAPCVPCASCLLLLLQDWKEHSEEKKWTSMSHMGHGTGTPADQPCWIAEVSANALGGGDQPRPAAFPLQRCGNAVDRFGRARGHSMRLVFAVWVIGVFFVSPASAQDTADQIRGRLKDGQKVSVTDEQGREFKGRVVNMASDVLTLANSRDRADIRYEQIVKIERSDGLLNGTLIGLGIGAALGLAVVGDSSGCDEGAFLFCGDPDAGNYVATALVFGGIGAGIGVGIDALIGRHRNIYQRGSVPRISFVPAVGRSGASAMVAVSW